MLSPLTTQHPTGTPSPPGQSGSVWAVQSCSVQGAPWSTCTGNLQKCWVSKPMALKVVQHDKSCWSSPKPSNLPSASKRKVGSWTEKGKSTRKRTAWDPAAPLALTKLVWREEPRNLSAPSPTEGLSLPQTWEASLCPAADTGWSLGPWPYVAGGTGTPQVQPPHGSSWHSDSGWADAFASLASLSAPNTAAVRQKFDQQQQQDTRLFKWSSHLL